MILRLIFFSISWAVYALTFFALASTLGGFHSAYVQSTFTIALQVGFVNVLLIVIARFIYAKVPIPVLALIVLLADYPLIQSTTDGAIGYYVTGHKAATIASVVLAIVAWLTEFVKDRIRADISA
jgi:uncharacterized membrane protein YvlD (DUF360 family)